MGTLFRYFCWVLAFYTTSFVFALEQSARDIPKFYDQDGDRIFENLRDRMKKARASELIPVIVKYKDETPSGNLAVRLKSGSGRVRRAYRSLPALSTSLTSNEIEQLSRDPMIEHVELDAVVKVAMDTAKSSMGVQQIRTQFKYDGNRDTLNAYTPNDVVIAIIDTGINTTHPDLRRKVIYWKDYLEQRAQPYDDHGHGTAVAAVAAGTGKLDRAYSGVAPGAALVVLRVLDSGGSGTLSDAIAAVDEVISKKSELNIRVLNLSFTASGNSNGRDALSQICNRAVSNGIVVVAAAGNDGPNPRTIGMPSAASAVITVGAGADLGARGFYIADFSSRGPTADGRIKPDIWAPGVSIRTARRMGYGEFTGTSLAAPFVSGVVALMLDANPSLTPPRIKGILYSSALRWSPGGKSPEAGFGRLQAYQAITRSAAITANLRPPDVPLLQSLKKTIGQGEEQIVEFKIKSVRYPVAITCVSTAFLSSDIDLELISPSGNVLATAATLSRQETIRFLPTARGTYRIRLKNPFGSTGYLLNISGDLE